MKKIIPASFLALLLCAASAQAKRPLNPKRFKQKGTAAGKTAAPARAVPARVIPRLPPGRWDPAIKSAIEEFVADHSSAAASYDAARPPVALLPWNDALVAGDAGSIVFQKLVERAEFKFDDEFWSLVPLEYGRQRLRSDYEAFTLHPVSVWGEQPEYRQYRKGFLAVYRDMCVKVGRAECRAWLTRLFAGFTEDEVAHYAQGALREETLREQAEEAVYAAAEDTMPVRVRRGMAPVPELRALVALLLGAGFDIWVIDTDSHGVLEAAVRGWGIDSSRVEGVRLGLAKEKLTSEIVSPIPIRAGKVEVAASLIGRPPKLVIGVKAEDEDILRYSDGLRLVLGEDASLRGVAAERGWHVQGAFLLYHPGVPSLRRGE